MYQWLLFSRSLAAVLSVVIFSVPVFFISYANILRVSATDGCWWVIPIGSRIDLVFRHEYFTGFVYGGAKHVR